MNELNLFHMGKEAVLTIQNQFLHIYYLSSFIKFKTLPLFRGRDKKSLALFCPLLMLCHIYFCILFMYCRSNTVHKIQPPKDLPWIQCSRSGSERIRTFLQDSDPDPNNLFGTRSWAERIRMQNLCCKTWVFMF